MSISSLLDKSTDAMKLLLPSILSQINFKEIIYSEINVDSENHFENKKLLLQRIRISIEGLDSQFLKSILTEKYDFGKYIIHKLKNQMKEEETVEFFLELMYHIINNPSDSIQHPNISPIILSILLQNCTSQNFDLINYLTRIVFSKIPTMSIKARALACKILGLLSNSEFKYAIRTVPDEILHGFVLNMQSQSESDLHVDYCAFILGLCSMDHMNRQIMANEVGVIKGLAEIISKRKMNLLEISCECMKRVSEFEYTHELYDHTLNLFDLLFNYVTDYIHDIGNSRHDAFVALFNLYSHRAVTATLIHKLVESLTLDKGSVCSALILADISCKPDMINFLRDLDEPSSINLSKVLITIASSRSGSCIQTHACTTLGHLQTEIPHALIIKIIDLLSFGSTLEKYFALKSLLALYPLNTNPHLHNEDMHFTRITDMNRLAFLEIGVSEANNIMTSFIEILCDPAAPEATLHLLTQVLGNFSESSECKFLILKNYLGIFETLLRTLDTRNLISACFIADVSKVFSSFGLTSIRILEIVNYNLIECTSSSSSSSCSGFEYSRCLHSLRAVLALASQDSYKNSLIMDERLITKIELLAVKSTGPLQHFASLCLTTLKIFIGPAVLDSLCHSALNTDDKLIFNRHFASQSLHNFVTHGEYHVSIWKKSKLVPTIQRFLDSENIYTRRIGLEISFNRGFIVSITCINNLCDIVADNYEVFWKRKEALLGLELLSNSSGNAMVMATTLESSAPTLFENIFTNSVSSGGGDLELMLITSRIVNNLQFLLSEDCLNALLLNHTQAHGLESLSPSPSLLWKDKIFLNILNNISHSNAPQLSKLPNLKLLLQRIFLHSQDYSFKKSAYLLMKQLQISIPNPSLLLIAALTTATEPSEASSSITSRSDVYLIFSILLDISSEPNLAPMLSHALKKVVLAIFESSSACGLRYLSSCVLKNVDYPIECKIISLLHGKLSPEKSSSTKQTTISFWYKWNALRSLITVLENTNSSTSTVSTINCTHSESIFEDFIELIETMLFTPDKGEIKVLCCEILFHFKITTSQKFISSLEEDLFSGNESYSLYDHFYSLRCLKVVLSFELNISTVQTYHGQIIDSLKALCSETTSIYSDIPHEALVLLQTSFTAPMLLELVTAIYECSNFWEKKMLLSIIASAKDNTLLFTEIPLVVHRLKTIAIEQYDGCGLTSGICKLLCDIKSGFDRQFIKSLWDKASACKKSSINISVFVHDLNYLCKSFLPSAETLGDRRILNIADILLEISPHSVWEVSDAVACVSAAEQGEIIESSIASILTFSETVNFDTSHAVRCLTSLARYQDKVTSLVPILLHTKYSLMSKLTAVITNPNADIEILNAIATLIKILGACPGQVFLDCLIKAVEDDTTHRFYPRRRFAYLDILRVVTEVMSKSSGASLRGSVKDAKINLVNQIKAEIFTSGSSPTLEFFLGLDLPSPPSITNFIFDYLSSNLNANYMGNKLLGLILNMCKYKRAKKNLLTLDIDVESTLTVFLQESEYSFGNVLMVGNIISALRIEPGAELLEHMVFSIRNTCASVRAAEYVEALIVIFNHNNNTVMSMKSASLQALKKNFSELTAAMFEEIRCVGSSPIFKLFNLVDITSVSADIITLILKALFDESVSVFLKLKYLNFLSEVIDANDMKRKLQLSKKEIVTEFTKLIQSGNIDSVMVRILCSIISTLAHSPSKDFVAFMLSVIAVNPTRRIDTYRRSSYVNALLNICTISACKRALRDYLSGEEHDQLLHNQLIEEITARGISPILRLFLCMDFGPSLEYLVAMLNTIADENVPNPSKQNRLLLLSGLADKKEIRKKILSTDLSAIEKILTCVKCSHSDPDTVFQACNAIKILNSDPGQNFIDFMIGKIASAATASSSSEHSSNFSNARSKFVESLISASTGIKGTKQTFTEVLTLHASRLQPELIDEISRFGNSSILKLFQVAGLFPFSNNLNDILSILLNSTTPDFVKRKILDVLIESAKNISFDIFAINKLITFMKSSKRDPELIIKSCEIIAMAVQSQADPGIGFVEFILEEIRNGSYSQPIRHRFVDLLLVISDSPTHRTVRSSLDRIIKADNKLIDKSMVQEIISTGDSPILKIGKHLNMSVPVTLYAQLLDALSSPLTMVHVKQNLSHILLVEIQDRYVRKYLLTSPEVKCKEKLFSCIKHSKFDSKVVNNICKVISILLLDVGFEFVRYMLTVIGDENDLQSYAFMKATYVDALLLVANEIYSAKILLRENIKLKLESQMIMEVSTTGESSILKLFHCADVFPTSLSTRSILKNLVSSSVSVDIKQNLAGILWKLSEMTEFDKYFKTEDVISAITKYGQSSDVGKDGRDIIFHIFKAMRCSVPMPFLRIIALDLLNSAKRSSLAISCHSILILSQNALNVPPLLEPQLNIASGLENVIKTEDFEAMHLHSATAMGILNILPDSSVISLFIDILRDSTDESLLQKVLELFKALVSSAVNAERLSAPSVGFIEVVEKLCLVRNSNSSLIQSLCLRILGRMNYLPLDFIGATIEALSSQDDPHKRMEYITKLTVFIQEISVFKDGLPGLYDPDLKLLDTIVKTASDQLKLSKGEDEAFMRLVFIIAKKIPVMTHVFASNISKIIFAELKSYDLGLRENDVDKRFRYGIMALMFISKWPQAWAPLNEVSGLVIWLKELIDDNDSKTSLCATMVLCYLVGRDESSSHVLRQYPGHIQQVIGGLVATASKNVFLDWVEEIYIDEFHIRAILQLAICAENKPHIAKKSVVKSLVDIIANFHSFTRRNIVIIKPPSSDGDADVNTYREKIPAIPVSRVLHSAAEWAIETLLQISLLYDDDEKLQKSDIFSEYLDTQANIEYITGILNEFLSNHNSPLVSISISLSAKKSAVLLMHRLNLSIDWPQNDVTGISCSFRKAVLVSYCDHRDRDSNLNNVVKLQDAFKELCIEVWVDTIDSSGQIIFDPQIYLDSFESCAAIVICLSKHYRESANCQMEAHLALRQRKERHVKIFFCLMEETSPSNSSSNGSSIDRWMAHLMQTKKGYPLWKASHVNQVAEAIAKLLPNECRIGLETSTSDATDSATESQSSQLFEPINSSFNESDDDVFPTHSSSPGPSKPLPERKQQLDSASAFHSPIFKNSLTPVNTTNSTSFSTPGTPFGTGSSRLGAASPSRMATSIASTSEMPEFIQDVYLRNLEMWGILFRPQNNLDGIFLIFKDIGIDDAQSLSYCTEADFRRLAKCLTKIRSKAFLTLAGLSEE